EPVEDQPDRRLRHAVQALCADPAGERQIQEGAGRRQDRRRARRGDHPERGALPEGRPPDRAEDAEGLRHGFSSKTRIPILRRRIAHPAFSTPRATWSASIDSNSALKLPAPKPSSPFLWMNSKKIGPITVFENTCSRMRVSPPSTTPSP